MKALAFCILLIIGLLVPTLARAQSADTTMKAYRDVKHTSNVSGYGAGKTWIIVQFKDGSMYLYTNKSCGTDQVREMKRLGALGEGLNSYINKTIKEGYAKKLR
jgi:hypothetical protein